MHELLHPLFVWPLLAGFIVGVGLTSRLLLKKRHGYAANLDER